MDCCCCCSIGVDCCSIGVDCWSIGVDCWSMDICGCICCCCVGMDICCCNCGPEPRGRPEGWFQSPASRINLELAIPCIFDINRGLFCIMGKMLRAGIKNRLQMVKATTSAVLGSPERREISPKHSPASRKAICLPRTDTAHRPESITNNGPGDCPAEIMTCPACAVTGCIMFTISETREASRPIRICNLCASSIILWPSIPGTLLTGIDDDILGCILRDGPT
mmetsp:Transcript_18465/g.60624  ORF Transcript_18465/g.60624 Transcript_18465/m.60624 type:complete len:223 (+) Transcript_18465:1805-2473(+)